MMKKRLLRPNEPGAYLAPEVIVERSRAIFASVSVHRPLRKSEPTGLERLINRLPGLETGGNWIRNRLLGPKLAAETMERLRDAILFTVATEYGLPALDCLAIPGQLLEVVVVDEWREWPDYKVNDQEGAELLLQQLAQLLGYTLIPQ